MCLYIHLVTASTQWKAAATACGLPGVVWVWMGSSHLLLHAAHHHMGAYASTQPPVQPRMCPPPLLWHPWHMALPLCRSHVLWFYGEWVRLINVCESEVKHERGKSWWGLNEVGWVKKIERYRKKKMKICCFCEQAYTLYLFSVFSEISSCVDFMLSLHTLLIICLLLQLLLTLDDDLSHTPRENIPVFWSDGCGLSFAGPPSRDIYLP